MSIRTILLPLRESDMSQNMITSGLQAAKTFSAHLDVFFVHPRAEDMLPFATLGMTESMKAQIRANARSSSIGQSQRLRELYEAARERAGVIAAVRGARPGEATSDWVEAHGVRSSEVARHGRLADLMLIPRPERANPPPKTFEAMLRETGRPVVMLPRGSATGAITGHVVVGWNGSSEAARAVAGALPILYGASAVTVLMIEDRTAAQPDASAVVNYLRCHGVSASAKTVPHSGQHAGEQLLSECSELAAQLLVVGCYSRTRLQEMLLGGATRYLIREAAIPVLLVH